MLLVFRTDLPTSWKNSIGDGIRELVVNVMKLINRSSKITKLAISCMTACAVLLFAQVCTTVGLQTAGIEQSYFGVAAAKEKKEESKRSTRKTPALRNKVYEKLSAAQQAAEAGNMEEAIAILDELKNRTGKKALNSYENANLWNFYAFIYYSKENYKDAIRSYENVLKQADLPEAMEVGTKYSLAQLYFVIEDFPNAIKALEGWFKVAVNPAPDAYVLLGQAYLQVKNYDSALVQIEKAMTVARQKGKEPKENWYLLLRFLYNEKNDNNKQLEVLTVLVDKWPKKEYWLGLSGVYGALNQEGKQLYALETAYVQGLLTREGELVSLSQMLAATGMPYKAAKVMDKGIKEGLIKESSKNVERLGEYWRRSQETEKALPKLEVAAKSASSGEPYLRLAHIYYSLDRFSEAANAARGAVKLGGLKRPMDAHMLQGQALFYTKKYEGARTAFNKVLADNEKKNARNRKIAQQWMKYMEREIVRQREISKYLQS